MASQAVKKRPPLTRPIADARPPRGHIFLVGGALCFVPVSLSIASLRFPSFRLRRGLAVTVSVCAVRRFGLYLRAIGPIAVVGVAAIGSPAPAGLPLVTLSATVTLPRDGHILQRSGRRKLIRRKKTCVTLTDVLHSHRIVCSTAEFCTIRPRRLDRSHWRDSRRGKSKLGSDPDKWLMYLTTLSTIAFN